MKLITVLLIMALVQAGATGYSQKVTLREKNASVETVFQAIEKQTGYVFFYDHADLQHQKISINLKNVTLVEALDRCFAKLPLTYKIIGTTIAIKRKERVTPNKDQPGTSSLKIVSPTTSPASAPLSFLHREMTTLPKPVVQRIVGKVNDENGEPLPGVSILIKGTQQGTTTDGEGRFQIEVSNENAVLVFSFVGYVSQEVVVGSRSTLDISLEIDEKSLEEVVVVGYGVVRKSDLTGSLSSVKGKDINAFPTTNALQALVGRAAGVQVVQNTGAPGGAISVRIRGTNSIRGSNEPLYVVDGFPMVGSNPTILNNSDIESIEVLKDASATAIYGSRGANGVVLITTKKGKSGVTTVDYESSFSIQKLRNKIDMMNAKEYATYYNKVAANDGLPQRFNDSDIAALGEGFDWQDFVFKNALMQNHNLTLSGGNEKTQILTSLSVFKQDGIIRNSGYDRYSIRTVINHDFNSKLSVSANVLLSKISQLNQNSSGGGRGISLIAGALNSFPTHTPYNEDGSIRNLRTIYPWAIEISNPAYYFDETKSVGRSNKVLTNLAIAYRPLKDLTVRVAGGIEFSGDKSDYYQSTRYINSNSSASVSTSETMSLLGETTLTYSKSLDKHNFNLMGGFTYQDFLTTSLSAGGVGFLSDLFETYNIGAATSPGVPQTGYSLATLLSSIARLNYNYNDKLLATISFRADGSSRYSEGSKWGYFPSGALAWRISNEEFLKYNATVSDLKLRFGWGVTGSQAISPYSTLNALSSNKVAMGDGLYTTFGPGTVLPGNLRWETTRQFNFGVDAGFFENRFRLTVDYYNKTTVDLLNPVPMPASTGYVSTIRNVGSIENKGIELDLSTDILRGKVKWTLDGNISFNRSKVSKLSNGADILGSFYNVTLFNDHINILREGEAFGAFFGYLTDGYDEAGRIKYKDVNNDGVLNISDKVVIGNPNPNFFYGLNSSLSYKNFGLTFFLQGVSGNDIFNLSSVNNTLDAFFGGNMPRAVLTNHWSPENNNAKYPIPSTRNTVRVSDRFVENGSYLRLRNVQLTYDIPVPPNGVLKNAQVYVGGQNLLTFTKYSWWDPEVNSAGGSSSINQGIDYHTYPNYKSVIFGVRVKF